MNTGNIRHRQYGLLHDADANACACGLAGSGEWSRVAYTSLEMLRTDLVTIEGDPGSSG